MSRDAHILLASAGSGKTWRLTTHCLRLLARGVPPDRILASTFTRKAAGEILGRIFARLAEAASSEARKNELDRALELNSAPHFYAELLARLVRDVHRFRVRTLDSFFVDLARAFASELALPPEWTVADEFEVERARSEALGRAIESGSANDWVLLLRELERDSDSRSVLATLSKLVVDAHAVARESDSSAWDRLPRPEAVDPARLHASLEYLARFQVPVGLTKKPDANWVKARDKSVKLAAARDWEGLFGDGLGNKVLLGEENYQKRPISDELRDALMCIARQGARELAEVIIRQNRATRRWLDTFDAAYRGTQAERGWVQFDDLPAALCSGRDGRNVLDDLALRLDARIDHLLLDEFQDTSPPQWRVLAPIAEELAADGTGTRSFFCVGDAKQSIYGWRSAEPRLFEELPSRLHIEPEKLAESRRSAQVVLDAVNAVFERLGDNLVFDHWSDDSASAREFQGAFQHHVAHDRSLRGAVRLHTCAPGQTASERARAAVDATADLVAELRARAPEASIAVLLRRRALAPRIVKRLRDSGVAASDEGGNPLTDSVAVLAALAWLHWLDHPGDGVAQFHAATSVFGAVFGLHVTSDEREVAEVHRRSRVVMLDRGLAEFLAVARPAVERELGSWEARRFGQLIDLALAWSRESSLRTRDFRARVRQHRVEDSTAAQVKVMTIHASKGLEFDAVILPELDLDFVKAARGLVWRRAEEDPTREIESVSRAASKVVRDVLARSNVSLLAELDASMRKRALRDGLSALYVAMTRARCSLDLVLHPKGSKAPRLAPAGVLREAFGLTHADLDPSRVHLECEGSDPTWVETFVRRERPEAIATSYVPPKFSAPRRPRELEREQPSKIDPPRRVATRELFAPSNDAGRLRGRRFHAWVENIEWLGERSDGEQELVAAAQTLGLGGGTLLQDARLFLDALQRPVLRALLARPSPEHEVWRERRFRIVDHDKLQTGAFDRVVVHRVAGRVVGARLVDFKSDRTGGDAARCAQIAEQYAGQLSSYRHALSRIAGLAESELAAELYFFDGDTLVPL